MSINQLSNPVYQETQEVFCKGLNRTALPQVGDVLTQDGFGDAVWQAGGGGGGSNIYNSDGTISAPLRICHIPKNTNISFQPDSSGSSFDVNFNGQSRPVSDGQPAFILNSTDFLGTGKGGVGFVQNNSVPSVGSHLYMALANIIGQEQVFIGETNDANLAADLVLLDGTWKLESSDTSVLLHNQIELGGTINNHILLETQNGVNSQSIRLEGSTTEIDIDSKTINLIQVPSTNVQVVKQSLVRNSVTGEIEQAVIAGGGSVDWYPNGGILHAPVVNGDVLQMVTGTIYFLSYALSDLSFANFPIALVAGEHLAISIEKAPATQVTIAGLAGQKISNMSTSARASTVSYLVDDDDNYWNSRICHFISVELAPGILYWFCFGMPITNVNMGTRDIGLTDQQMVKWDGVNKDLIPVPGGNTYNDRLRYTTSGLEFVLKNVINVFADSQAMPAVINGVAETLTNGTTSVSIGAEISYNSVNGSFTFSNTELKYFRFTYQADFNAVSGVVTAVFCPNMLTTWTFPAGGAAIARTTCNGNLYLANATGSPFVSTTTKLLYANDAIIAVNNGDTFSLRIVLSGAGGNVNIVVNHRITIEEI